MFDLELFQRFLNEFCTEDNTGNKNFKYYHHLTKLAHREQVSMYVEMDDVYEFDVELADAIMKNTRRYTNLVSDVVFEMLPKFIQHDVIAKDALDVFIEHRKMMEQRVHRPNEPNADSNKFPTELMRR